MEQQPLHTACEGRSTRLPEPIVIGSDWSRHPMPGQTAMDLRPAGYREHHPECDGLCDQYPGTRNNRCWSDPS